MQCTIGLRQVQLSQDLIAFRALSGCDNTSFTAGHSKKIVWQVSYDRHELRCDLRDDDQTQETISSARAFRCHAFNVPDHVHITNEARCMLFSLVKKH